MHVFTSSGQRGAELLGRVPLTAAAAAPASQGRRCSCSGEVSDAGARNPHQHLPSQRFYFCNHSRAAGVVVFPLRFVCVSMTMKDVVHDPLRLLPAHLS